VWLLSVLGVLGRFRWRRFWRKSTDLLARKSQIAIEYSQRLRHQYADTWVFWVHASNAERFEQAYREIATKLAIPGRDDLKVDILRLVWAWLVDEANGRWLMILDNADDANLFSCQTPESSTDGSKPTVKHAPLLSFLPQAAHGSILVTSRNRSAAIRLVGDYQNLIDVGPMDEQEGMTLLNTKLRVDSTAEADARLLLQDLGYVPLAITQAAAYINIRATRMSISKYLDIFRENEANRTKLLNEDVGDLRRDPGVPNAVITTWEISFDQIRKDRPLATELLSLMSVLDPQGIPESLLSRMYENRLGFEDALAPLIDFCLVTAESGRQAFDIHPLVQLATRKWLTVHSELQKWQTQSVKIISETLPDGQHENWKTCEALEPHVQTVLRYECTSQQGDLQRARILYNSAWYAYERGNYEVAKGRVQEAIKIREEMSEPDDEDRFDSLNLLGSILNDQGIWNEADELYVQAMKKGKRLLGQEHPTTLSSMQNLAQTYEMQGQWKKAEKLCVQLLEIRRRILGEEHYITLTSMANLARTYGDQGRWNEAEELEVQVLKMRKRILGLEHPNTLSSMSNLASTYLEQGRWNEAKELGVQVLEMSKRILGLEHPGTLINMGNLAEIYKSQRRWNEAEELEVQVLEMSKRILGLEHPNTLIRIANLAWTWKSQGCNEKAVELMSEAVQLSKRKVGAGHPDTKDWTLWLNEWRAEETEEAEEEAEDVEEADMEDLEV
jgi:tetratricopeptide (TPR) repeat protein